MKFRKKPIVIDAFKWTGDRDQEEDPEWIVAAMKEGSVQIQEVNDKCYMIINTLEGDMIARQGDYIIKGVQGEIYPCKPEIFLKTYDKVE